MARFRSTYFFLPQTSFCNPSSTPDISNMSELDRFMTSLVAVGTFIFGEHVAKLNMNTPITILHVILGVQNTGQDLQTP